MADKEATVYIVDVGSSMGKKRNGREETDLDWAMQYVWDKITSTVSTGRKTLTIGVVGLRTDGTANELQSDESFEHITVLHQISQILLPDLRQLRGKIAVSGTRKGDAISAIVVAIQMIGDYCKKLKYRRKIVLVTDGRGSMDDDGVDEIVNKIKEDNIELVVLGVDYDDDEFGVKEEGKEPIKAKNELLLRSLAEKCDGIYGTMQQAVSELGIPRVKAVKPVPSFKGRLTLGDPEKTVLSIEVERYPRTMIARAPSASQFVVRATGEGNTQSTATITEDDPMPDAKDNAPENANLTAVRSARTYQVVDEEAIGGKRDVEREDLAKGYEYGRTAVHISESEENVTKLETTAGLEILGFVPREKYERYMNMSVAGAIIAQKANDRAGMALSSFIHSLFELDSYAVARLVTKNDKPPVLVILAPSIEVDYECLLDVQVPFAEDVRPYRFPPLDKIVTVSGKVLTEHRNLPNEKLTQAMSDYVDQMDLSTLETNDQGNRTEYMAMEDTYSPVLHRIDQAVRWRAVHPSNPIPPPYEILTRYSHIPEKLETRARPQLGRLVDAANIKKVPPRVKGRKGKRETVKPLSGLNIDELLGREQRTEITAENVVPEFKQMLATAEDPKVIEEAAKQMSTVITAQITHSFGDSGYGRATEALRVMREELINMEEPKLYNDFLKDLKNKLLSGDLGGDRKEMWWIIRKDRLGLIDTSESDASDTKEEEAKLFLSKT